MMKKYRIWIIIGLIFGVPILYGIFLLPKEEKKQPQIIVKLVEPQKIKIESIDKSIKIAAWIESEVNVGGYSGCECRSLGTEFVKCNLYFPAGADTLSVEVNVKGVAELFAQAGRLAATIHYIGFSGYQKVCEYKYDMYNATVIKIK